MRVSVVIIMFLHSYVSIHEFIQTFLPVTQQRAECRLSQVDVQGLHEQEERF